MQELDFSQTRFRTKNMYATVCKRMGFDKDTDLDFFSNYEEYQKTKRALINEHLSITSGNMEGSSILSSRYHYPKNYDILWGGRNIIFNEYVKQALEEINLIVKENKLEIVEFTNYEIQMLGE